MSLPLGWCRVPFGTVATLQRGFDLPERLRCEGRYPVISSGGTVGTHNEAKARGPGVVTGRYGTIGKVFFVQEDYWPLNTTLWVRDFKGNDPHYVFHLLRTLPFHLYSGKTGVTGVDRKDLHKVQVLLPPVDVQADIVRTLARWAAALEGLAQLIDARKRFRHGLMHALLTGKLRFDGFGKNEWRDAALGEWFTEFRAAQGNGTQLEVLSCTKNGIVPQRTRFSKRMASRSTRRYKVVSRGDFVYDPMLLWDGSMGFVNVAERGVVSPAYATLRFLGGESEKRFVSVLLDSPLLRHQFKVISQGTNQRRRKALPEDFLAITCRIPTQADERAKIGELTRLLNDEITRLKKLRAALDHQRRGVTELLLAGKIPIPS